MKFAYIKVVKPQRESTANKFLEMFKRKNVSKDIREVGSIVNEYFKKVCHIYEIICKERDEEYIDEKGAFDITKCDLIAYANGKYFVLGKQIGKFGYSVQKKKSHTKSNKFM